jgi:outer membrane protein, multidrug efflux system
MSVKFLISGLAIIATSGCASIGGAGASATTTNATANLPSSFNQTRTVPVRNVTNDPVLAALLEQLPTNLDIAIAEGRLKEAQARLDAARAGLLPSVSGSVVTTSGSRDGVAGSSSASLGTSVQVPIDLFGANRGRVNAARARAEEAAFNKDRTIAVARATLLSLYVELRTAQAQIAVTQANRDSAADSLSLAIARQRAGLETGLGVAQATSNRDTIAARLPAFQQAEVAARLGLEALLGQLLGTQSASLSPTRAIPRFAVARLDTSPSDWLVTRPDLVAAARRLQAAGLDAQAAKRDRYPSLSLTALLNQTEASRGPTGLAGSVSSNLVSTLFDFGRLDALSRVAGAQAQTETALYRQAVLNAAADVETQASRVSRGVAGIDANDANVASAQDQARLARARYTSGLAGFLEVLTAERAVYEAQSAQVLAVSETARAEIDLNLALGF